MTNAEFQKKTAEGFEWFSKALQKQYLTDKVREAELRAMRSILADHIAGNDPIASKKLLSEIGAKAYNEFQEMIKADSELSKMVDDHFTDDLLKSIKPD